MFGPMNWPVASVSTMPITLRQSVRLSSALITSLVCLLLLSTSAATQGTPAKATVHNVREIGKALAACMEPISVAHHYPGMRITIRLGFNRRGEPLGPPRFAYLTPNAPDRIKAEYKSAITDALQRCTPLSFSPELGATIAGVPVILRFDERGLILGPAWRVISLCCSYSAALSPNSARAAGRANHAATHVSGAPNLAARYCQSNSKSVARTRNITGPARPLYDAGGSIRCAADRLFAIYGLMHAISVGGCEMTPKSRTRHRDFTARRISPGAF